MNADDALDGLHNQTHCRIPDSGLGAKARCGLGACPSNREYTPYAPHCVVRGQRNVRESFHVIKILQQGLKWKRKPAIGVRLFTKFGL